MARVTGIGGVFLRARDPKALTAWYVEHLGFQPGKHGVISFQWTDEIPAGTGQTTWNAFPHNTDYFGEGSTQAVMVNYRVDDLDGLLKKLTEADATLKPKREDYSYGKFAWITDPEGNRMELWEPVAKTTAEKPESR